MISAETVALFVQFVRLNPTLPADSPVILRAFFAYTDLAERDADEERDDFAGGAVG